MPGTPASDRRAVAVLQKARSLGVTTFQLPATSVSRRAERLLTTAFPSADDKLVLLVERSVPTLAQEAGGGMAGPPEGALEERLRRSVRECAERLHPLGVNLLQWRHAPDAYPPLEEVVEVLERLRREGAYGGWTLSVPSDGPLPRAGRATALGGAALYSGPFSLLNPALLRPLSERAQTGLIGLFAEDPFGGGRLDGSRFAESVADRRPGARPANLRELQREFDPVLRLGFLTEGHRRTMAQASLRFVLQWPWVCSALVPLPSPERLVELAGAEATPPLSEGEVARLLALFP